MRRSALVGGLLAEVNAVFRDPGTQWMVVACCGVYLGTFGYLRRRGKKLGDRRLELGAVGLVGFAALGYGLHYDQAAKTTQALTLFGATVLGQGVALCAGWGTGKDHWTTDHRATDQGRLEIEKAEIRNQKSDRER
jgi:hypothetical protein